MRDAAQPRLDLRDLLGGGGLRVGDLLGGGVARVGDPLDRGVARVRHRGLARRRAARRRRRGASLKRSRGAHPTQSKRRQHPASRRIARIALPAATSSVQWRKENTRPSRILGDGMSPLRRSHPGAREPPRRGRRGAAAPARVRGCGQRFTTFERRERAAAAGPQARRRAPALRPDEAPGRAAARDPQAPGERRRRRGAGRRRSRSRSRRPAASSTRSGSASSASRASGELDRGRLPAVPRHAPVAERGFCGVRPGGFRPGRARECIVTRSNGLRGRGKTCEEEIEDVGKRCKHRKNRGREG